MSTHDAATLTTRNAIHAAHAIRPLKNAHLQQLSPPVAWSPWAVETSNKDWGSKPLQRSIPFPEGWLFQMESVPFQPRLVALPVF